MKIRLGVPSTLALALMIAPRLPAQEAPPEPGARVRVTFSEQALVSQRRGGVLTQSKQLAVTGAVASWEPDTLVLDVGKGTQTAIPRSRISKLEVSRGSKSNVWKGVWIGAVAGFVAGFGTTALICSGSNCYSDGSDLWFALASGALVAPLGAGIGAGIGAANKSDRWEEVPAQPPPVALRLGRDGSFGLALALRL